MKAIAAARSIFSMRSQWPCRIAAVVILTALADWLFFRQSVGATLALFVVAIGLGVLFTHPTEARRWKLLPYLGVLIAAAIPVVEDVNVLSAPIATLGIACFALGITGALNGELKDRILAVGWFLISGPFQIFREWPLLRQWARQRGRPAGLNAMHSWIVPLACGAVFVALFAAANPLIANWLTQWELEPSLKRLDMRRFWFWLGAIVTIWMFVCVHRRFAPPDLKPTAAATGEGPQQPADPAAPGLTISIPPTSYADLIFNETAILRSLVLFNLLFGFQTAMDIHYLWRGAALPDGMSYASYAHRGAYPLIVTALLAAAFVIAAMRPGSASERSPRMRALVFLWVGQNVLLVASAILRLDLYVATYLLTYWRVAAFIWMLIVAAGLVLIVVRIVTYRTNTWLIAANFTVVALTIYLCSLVNFANLVASYNVAHARNAATAGAPIDLHYIATLGPQAIPALDRYIAAQSAPEWTATARRIQLAAAHQNYSVTWRAWTFRGWRLTRYLKTAKSPRP
jgi:Domain of unknown function (DUF4173)